MLCSVSAFASTGTITYDTTVPFGYTLGWGNNWQLDEHKLVQGIVTKVEVTPAPPTDLKAYFLGPPRTFHVVNTISY